MTFPFSKTDMHTVLNVRNVFFIGIFVQNFEKMTSKYTVAKPIIGLATMRLLSENMFKYVGFIAKLNENIRRS